MTCPPSHKLKVKELQFLFFYFGSYAQPTLNQLSLLLSLLLPLLLTILLPSHFSFEVFPSALGFLSSSFSPQMRAKKTARGQHDFSHMFVILHKSTHR